MRGKEGILLVRKEEKGTDQTSSGKMKSVLEKKQVLIFSVNTNLAHEREFVYYLQ